MHAPQRAPTNETEIQAARRLSDTVISLLDRECFFATLAMQLRLISDPSRETFASEGKHLRYNPRWVMEATGAHLKTGIASLVLACALKHHTRQGERDPALYQIASQIVRHRLLKESGYDLPPNAPYLDLDVSVEELYERLAEEADKRPDPTNALDSKLQQLAQDHLSLSNALDAARNPDPDHDHTPDSPSSAASDTDDADPHSSAGDPPDAHTTNPQDADTADPHDDAPPVNAPPDAITGANPAGASSDTSPDDPAPNDTDPATGDPSPNPSDDPVADPFGTGQIMPFETRSDVEDHLAQALTDTPVAEHDTPDAPAPAPHAPAALNESDRAQEEAQWDAALHQAHNISAAQGKTSAMGTALVDMTRLERVNFHTLLARYMHSLHEPDADWSQPNRRFISQGLYLPALLPRARGIDTLVIAIDTSASINQTVLRIFWSRTREILVQINPTLICILLADDQIRDDLRYTAGSIPTHLEAKGRGSTDFRPVFEHIEDQRLRPELLLYLTDLDGPFPQRPPRYPVVWLNYARYCATRTAPWGRQIDLYPSA